MKIFFGALLAVALANATPALAREQFPGQYADVAPAVRDWFRSQKSPATGALCCNEADGEVAEEDIRDGHYWVRSPMTGGKWIQVPDEVVIREANRYGRPVAWYWYEAGEPRIRCYAPGGGV